MSLEPTRSLMAAPLDQAAPIGITGPGGEGGLPVVSLVLGIQGSWPTSLDECHIQLYLHPLDVDLVNGGAKSHWFPAPSLTHLSQ